MKAERDTTRPSAPDLQALPAGQKPVLDPMWLQQLIARTETTGRVQRNMMQMSRAFFSGRQWAEKTLRERKFGKRLSLTFNRLARYVNQLVGEWAQLRLMPDVSPRDFPGEDLSALPDMIEMGQGEPDIPRDQMLEGWIRHRLNSKAFKDESRTISKQQYAMGLAYYLIYTEYAGPDTMHQDFGVEALPNPVNVLMDPFHRRVDGTDATWALVSNWHHKTKVKADHPGLDTDMLRGDELVGQVDLEGYDDDVWMDEKERIRVSHFWQMIETTVPVVLMSNGDRVPVELMEEAKPGKPSLKDDYMMMGIEELGRRDIPVRNIWHWELVGPKIIRGPELTYWKTLPVIKVPGRQAWNGAQRVYQSLIYSMLDAQRASNVAMSAAVERVQTSSLGVFVATKQQLTGYERDWELSNVRRKQVLYYNRIAEDGITVNDPPTRVEGAQIDAATLDAIRLMRAEEAGLAGLDEAGFGFENNSTSERSQALRMRGQRLSTSEFQDNHARSIEVVCENWLHAMPHYFDGARTQTIQDRDGALRKVRLNASIRRDAETGEEYVVNSMQQQRDMNLHIRMVPGDMTRLQEGWAHINELAKGTMAGERLIDVAAEALNMPNAGKIKRRVRSMLEVEDMDEEERANWEEGQLNAEIARENAIQRIAEWRRDQGLPPKQPPPQQIEAQAKAQTAQAKAQQSEGKIAEQELRAELMQMKEQLDLSLKQLELQGKELENAKTSIEAAVKARELDESMTDQLKDAARRAVLEVLEEPAPAKKEGSGA